MRKLLIISFAVTALLSCTNSTQKEKTESSQITTEDIIGTWERIHSYTQNQDYKGNLHYNDTTIYTFYSYGIYNTFHGYSQKYDHYDNIFGHNTFVAGSWKLQNDTLYLTPDETSYRECNFGKDPTAVLGTVYMKDLDPAHIVINEIASDSLFGKHEGAFIYNLRLKRSRIEMPSIIEE